MKERPILFSGAMVRAILEGRKTQTRRVVKQLSGFGNVTDFQPTKTPGFDWMFRNVRKLWNDLTHNRVLSACPYGQAGDRLWVRETFCVGYEYEPGKFAALPFDGCEKTRKAFYRATDDDAPNEPTRPWKPSIHMPRWASRITLEIVSVRVERLQNISHADARAEGAPMPTTEMGLTHGEQGDWRGSYRLLWDSINHKRGFGWDVNPWVWVIEFKRVTA